MLLYEQVCDVPAMAGCDGIIDHFRDAITTTMSPHGCPIRFAVTATDTDGYRCELGIIETDDGTARLPIPDLFAFRRRSIERTGSFNAVMIVPTGIGAALGGHAGDATPAAQLLAEACETLITHPNVINASDIAELPPNGLYVEGSVLTRLMMGTIGLQRVRANRVLAVIERHPNEMFVTDTINAVNAARATYGLMCSEVLILHSPYRMRARFTKSGSAAGRVEALQPLIEELNGRRERFDAVALASIIDVPDYTQDDYFGSNSECVNPWGGVEAMLTHAISGMFDVPSAHAPMMESVDVANMNFGVVDPRKAAETVSLTFFNSVLLGLQRSPRIVRDPAAMGDHSVLSASDLSVLVQPEGCLGLPTLAALEQGIPVIAVRENTTVTRTRLGDLPWMDGQFRIVDNYVEAAGMMLAMRVGIVDESVRRPIKAVAVIDLKAASSSVEGDSSGSESENGRASGEASSAVANLGTSDEG